MPDLFTYTPPPAPERIPHARGSATSKAAAESIRPSLGPLEQRVLDALAAAGTRGLTCQETEASTGLEHTTCSARMKGLEIKGRVRKTAETRPTRSGRMATVYRAAEARV